MPMLKVSPRGGGARKASAPKKKKRAEKKAKRPRRAKKVRGMGLGSVLFVLATLTVAWGGLGARIAYLHSGKNAYLRHRVDFLRPMVDNVSAGRGRIFDRNEQLLALDLPVQQVNADPQMLASNKQVGAVALCLSRTLGLPLEEVVKRLDQPKRRGVTVYPFAEPEQVARLKEELTAKELRGVSYQPGFKRMYPGGTLACHVVGFANREGVGGAGVEQACNGLLSPHYGLLKSIKDGKQKEIFTRRNIDVEAGDGADVYLTLDQNVQYFAEKALAAAVEEYEALAGWVIVEEVRTGAILGMASWPAYDPAKFNTAEEGSRKNRAVSFNYEPGSIFKVGVVAAALDAGIISTNDLFDCEMGHWTYKGRRLNDFHPYGVLDVAGILAKSSNVGSAKIAVMLGEERLHRYLEAYGFGRKTGVGLPDEETGILYSLANWRKHGIDITRIAIGHSVSVTALQMVNFLCCIGNDGYLMKPFLVRKVVDRNGEVLEEREPEVAGRPLRERTAEQMRAMLATVTGPEGTAKKASLAGYSVAGKTGTAEKIENGHYAKSKNYTSFMGLVPAERPEIGIIVVLDEPHKNRTAGQCAAPFFAEVAKPVVKYLDILPTGADDIVEYEQVVWED